MILGVRSVERGTQAKTEILAKLKYSLNIEIWQVDMASFASVTQFAERCNALDRLDAVAMNAGVYCDKPYQDTMDGNEVT
jgi:retinol dehydrogenase-12